MNKDLYMKCLFDCHYIEEYTDNDNHDNYNRKKRIMFDKPIIRPNIGSYIYNSDTKSVEFRCPYVLESLQHFTFPKGVTKLIITPTEKINETKIYKN